tara:strand:- start:130 stop:1548 length:1419 start_codon:yes stop_codon:yes gene_type:complete
MKINSKFNKKKHLDKFISLPHIIEKQFRLYKNQINKIIFFDLNQNEVNFYIKKKLIENFHFKKNSFHEKFFYFGIIKYFFIFFFFNLIIFLRRDNSFQKVKRKKILIDNIASENEALLFKDLDKTEYKDDYLIRVINKKILTNNKRFYFEKYKNYKLNIKDFFQCFNILFFGLKISIKFNFNFIYLFLKIVDEILFYKNFFQKFEFEYILMHQHYISNNIKNFYFKKRHGRKTCLIQKNILPLNNNNYLYDCDIFFSIGKNIGLNKEFTKSRVDKVKNVGSIFMNKSRFVIKKSLNINKVIDIICLGGNDLLPGGYYDVHDKYNEDYLEHLNWLVKLKEQKPELRIVFKHHANNKNKFEENFLKKGNIEVIDQKINSYELCLKSKFICSWCSTMIAELRNIDSNSFYLDPGKRNNLFLYQLNNRKNISIISFNQFRNRVDYFLKLKNKKQKPSKKFCYDYQNVIKNILKNLN